jgi:hypothetical protein
MTTSMLVWLPRVQGKRSQGGGRGGGARVRPHHLVLQAPGVGVGGWGAPPLGRRKGSGVENGHREGGKNRIVGQLVLRI